MDDIIKLDVGGCFYTTSRSSLTRYPDSMLGAMFSGRIPSVRDEQGRYVIDGDGTIFRYVLNFLRRSKLNLPEDFKEWDLLSTEVDFYQIKELIDAVTSLQEVRTAQKDSSVQEMEFIEITEFPPDKFTYKGSCESLEEIPLLFDSFHGHGYDNDTRLSVLSIVKTHGKITSPSPPPSPSPSPYQAYTYTEPSETERDRLDFSKHIMKIFQQISKAGFQLISTSSAGGSSDSYSTYREWKWLFSRKITAAMK